MSEPQLPHPQPEGQPQPYPYPQPPQGYPQPQAHPSPPGAPGGPVDPATLWAVPSQFPVAPPKVRKPRPWLRTALRWSIAVVLCAAVGTGTALGVMAPRRTDVPGLKTAADARYTFPGLVLPALPSKSPAPGDDTNVDHMHSADLRRLLLPAPVGAKPDTDFPGAKGWYPVSKFNALFTDNNASDADFVDLMAEDGVRHIAATAWTMPDGTRTEVYMLQFRSSSAASTLHSALTTGARLKKAPKVAFLDQLDVPALKGTQFTTGSGAAVAGTLPALRGAFLENGEIEVLVLMTNPKAVPMVDFTQVVTLQGELLQG